MKEHEDDEDIWYEGSRLQPAAGPEWGERIVTADTPGLGLGDGHAPPQRARTPVPRRNLPALRHGRVWWYHIASGVIADVEVSALDTYRANGWEPWSNRNMTE
jgi:hypothetical protein